MKVFRRLFCCCSPRREHGVGNASDSEEIDMTETRFHKSSGDAAAYVN